MQFYATKTSDNDFSRKKNLNQSCLMYMYRKYVLGHFVEKNSRDIIVFCSPWVYFLPSLNIQLIKFDVKRDLRIKSEKNL